VQTIYNSTFEVMPMLLVAVTWYLVITSVLNVGQGFIERYYGRGERGSAPAAKKPKIDAVSTAPAVEQEPSR
jgi:polar amino acid transport system permease protein